MAETTTSQRDEVRRIMPAGWRLWLWWVLARTVGWAVGAPVARAVGRLGAGPATALMGATVGAALGADLSWAALGAVYGAITGPVLVTLLRQPVPAASTGGQLEQGGSS